jgi:hypothetical protein
MMVAVEDPEMTVDFGHLSVIGSFVPRPFPLLQEPLLDALCLAHLVVSWIAVQECMHWQNAVGEIMLEPWQLLLEQVELT